MPPRLREEGGFDSGTRSNTQTTFGGSVSVSHANFQVLRTGDYKLTTDVVTPRFHQRIKSGEIINNPFHSWKEKRTESFSNSHVRNNTGPSNAVRDQVVSPGYVFPSTDPTDPTANKIDIGRLQALAGTAAAARVLQPELQGLVDIAEFHKTMELFRVRTGYLNRHLDSLYRFAAKKGKLRKGVNFLSSNWLKYRYGIMPLVYSAESVLLDMGKVRSKRVTARAEEEMTLEGASSQTATGTYWNCQFNHTFKRTVSVRAGLLYEYTGSYNELGLRATDVPAAAWELIPFSFVADWAVNMGDYIQAITPKVTARTLASWTTIHNEWSRDTELVATWNSVSGVTEIARPGGSSHHETLSKIRSPGLSVKPVFRVNAFQKASAPKRVIDAIALTVQLLQGKHRYGGSLTGVRI